MITKYDKFLYERYYDAFDTEDEVVPNEVLNVIKTKLGFKRMKRLGSGRYGTAFKIKGNKVLKITTDLKEYEYAKKIVGKKNKYIADIYDVYYFDYEDKKYAIIIKEFCNIDQDRMDDNIDKFIKYTKGDMSLSYLSSEYLAGDLSKIVFDSYIDEAIENDITWDIGEWRDMVNEIKKYRIYIKDFNGANVGYKPSNNNTYCVIELGFGYWDKIKFDKNDYLELNI